MFTGRSKRYSSKFCSSFRSCSCTGSNKFCSSSCYCASYSTTEEENQGERMLSLDNLALNMFPILLLHSTTLNHLQRCNNHHHSKLPQKSQHKIGSNGGSLVMKRVQGKVEQMEQMEKSRSSTR